MTYYIYTSSLKHELFTFKRKPNKWPLKESKWISFACFFNPILANFCSNNNNKGPRWCGLGEAIDGKTSPAAPILFSQTGNVSAVTFLASTPRCSLPFSSGTFRMFYHQLIKWSYSPVALLLLLLLTLKGKKKSLRAVKTCLYPTSGLTCGSSRQVYFLLCSRVDRARSLWQPSGGRGPVSTQASSLADWPVRCPTEPDWRSFFSDASSKKTSQQ